MSVDSKERTMAAHRMCFLSKIFRRLFRLKLTSLVWILFSSSFISLVLTCAYVTIYLDDDPDDRDYLEEFPEVEDETKIEDKIRLGDDAMDDLNLISSKLIDSSQVEIAGWWMPHVRWNPEIDCNTGQPGLCSKVLSVKCKPDSVRAIYQYLPINHKAVIKAIYFSASSSSSGLKMDNLYNIMVEAAMYSAIAVLKYTDNSQDRMRLDFSTGTHPYMTAELDKVLPSHKQLKSITVMLCCYGYQGSVKFLDIIVKPIINHDDTAGPDPYTEPSDYIDQCPEYNMQSLHHQKTSFDSEQIFTSDLNEATDVVTLVTHVSMDRIDILQKTIEYWQGPLSVTLFVPTKSKTPDTDHEWKRFYIKKKLKDSNFQTRCDLTAFYAKNADDDYPINYMRNNAIRQAKTQYLLLLDADFIPSPKLEENFQAVLRDFKTSSTETKVAYVVPAFEYSEDSKEPMRDPPRSKEDLKDKIFGVGSNIIPFRHFTSPESHRPTDYRVWYSSKEPYRVINYEDKYEPYIIVSNTPELPLFDENFTGYGMNKVTHTMELVAAGYDFEVLPHIWAVHVPHRVTSYTTTFLTDPLKRLDNRITRFEFVAKIMRKYELGPCAVQDRWHTARHVSRL